MKGIKVNITVNKGTDIKTACDSAKMLSELSKQEIDFVFNGVTITTVNKSINEMVQTYTTQQS